MENHHPGRTLLTSVAAFTVAGGFLMDWNKTHLFNPRWTPHAKFHDAMTILLGSLLGAGSLYLLQKKTGDAQQNLAWGTLLASFFFTAQAASFTFPGAKGIEAEFPHKVPKVGRVWLNELPFSLTMLAALGVGYALEKKRIR